MAGADARVIPMSVVGRASPPAAKSEKRTIRCFFLTSLLLMTLVSFGGMCAFSVLLLTQVEANIISQSRESSVNQVKDNSHAFIRDVGLVFQARLSSGISGLLLPSLYTVLDATAKCGSCGEFSVIPRASVADSKQPTTTVRKIDPQEKDPRFPELLSTKQSTVYFTDQKTAGVDAKWNAREGIINTTSHIDDWAPLFWNNDGKEFQSVYVGTEEGPMYRMFPGMLSDYEERNYDPTVRPWYSSAHAQAKKARNQGSWEPTQDILLPLAHSEPYNDFLTGRWMVTISKAFYYPSSSCLEKGLPECAADVADANFLGVVGTDMLIDDIRALVGALRLRDTGVAHLFETESSMIVASPSWKALASDSTGMYASEIGITSELLKEMRASEMGSIEKDGKLQVYRQLMNGRYILVMTTPVTEITAALDANVAEIQSTSSNLILIVSLSALGFAVLFAFLAVHLASSISKPLQEIERDASLIVGNIGGDLMAGVEINEHRESSVVQCSANCGADCGEVARLRSSFTCMLEELQEKRRLGFSRSLITNPFFNSEILSCNPDPGQVHCARPPAVGNDGMIKLKTKIGRFEDEPRVQAKKSKSDIACCNRLRSIILKRLVVPLSVVLLALVIVVSVLTFQNVAKWVSPVREALLEEETRSLPLRADTIDDLLTSVFDRCATSLHQYADHTEQVWNSAHNLPPAATSPAPVFRETPYEIYYSPFSGTADTSVKRTIQLSASPRFPSLQTNTKAGFFYQNGNLAALGESGFRDPQLRANWDSIKAAQRSLSHVYNAARATYFANELALQMFYGLEENETFVGYPYMDASSYKTWSGRCEVTNKRQVGYSPVCRSWYQSAKANGQKLQWSEMYVGAGTGLTMITASRALYDSNGKFFGVAGYDFTIDTLASAISETKLYKNGYAYLVDSTGGATLHPKLGEEKVLITSLEFKCEDDSFDEKGAKTYEETVLAKMLNLQPGGLEYDRCGAKWHIEWRPLKGTSYVVALTVADADITSGPDELAASIYASVTTALVVFIVLLVLFTIACVFFANEVSRQIVKPVQRIDKYVANLHATNYSVNFRATPQKYQELASIQHSLTELLVALRFGNAAFAKGKKPLEKQNYLKALTICQRNGSLKGCGVCYANIGSTLRVIESNARLKGQPMAAADGTSETWLQQSLAMEQQQVATPLTISQRLFNVALLRFDQHRGAEAKSILGQCFSIHRSHGDVKALAQYAYALARRLEEEKKQMDTAPMGIPVAAPANAVAIPVAGPPSLVQEFVGMPIDAPQPPSYAESFNQNACYDADVVKARDELSSIAQTFAVTAIQDPNCSATGFAMAAFTLGVLSNPEWLLWGLHYVQEMNVFTLAHLCSRLQLSPFVPQRLKEHVHGVVAERLLSFTWTPEGYTVSQGNQRSSKSLLFCLDVSGSMSGRRIQLCKQSIELIITKHSAPTDSLGLITFGSRVDIRCDMGTRPDALVQAVRSLGVGGRTRYHTAMKTSLSLLEKVEQTSEAWLVSLTDGSDNESTPTCRHDVVKCINEWSGITLNCVFIIVGQLQRKDYEAITSWEQACNANGFDAHIMNVDSTEGISAAFEAVANLMDAGTDVVEML